jgi:S1-C subfamily serine protease
MIRLLIHILILFFISLSTVSAEEASPACTLELEDVQYLRDPIVIKEMGKASIAAMESWNLLSATEGRQQLEDCVDQTVDCKLPRPRRRRQDAPDIYKSARKGTLVMGRLFTCSKCDNVHFAFSNTAFAISEDGHFVTNYHCITSYKNETPGMKELHGFVIRTWDGYHYPVSKILAGSEEQDLAILQVDLPKGEKLTPIPLGDAAEVGDTVYTVSHPDKMLYRFSTGIVTRNAMSRSRNINGTLTDRPRMSISADYAVGSSGGPVLDDRGNLIGIISTTSTVYAGAGTKRQHTQMIEKQTIPVASLRALIRPSK